MKTEQIHISERIFVIGEWGGAGRGWWSAEARLERSLRRPWHYSEALKEDCCGLGRRNELLLQGKFYNTLSPLETEGSDSTFLVQLIVNVR